LQPATSNLYPLNCSQALFQKAGNLCTFISGKLHYDQCLTAGNQHLAVNWDGVIGEKRTRTEFASNLVPTSTDNQLVPKDRAWPAIIDYLCGYDPTGQSPWK